MESYSSAVSWQVRTWTRRGILNAALSLFGFWLVLRPFLPLFAIPFFMARKKNRRRTRKARTHAARSTGPAVLSRPFEEHQQEVEELLSRGKVRRALELTKQIDSAFSSGPSRALLIRVYEERIHEMIGRGMNVEAGSLASVVVQRFPETEDRLKAVSRAAWLRAGKPEAVVAPLAEENLPPEERAELEALLRRELTDLQMLAKSDAVPAEHPLRKGASQLHEALVQVTSGPVDEETVALREIPRRSPLAPWKMLVRAIACLYQGRKQECERCLSAISEDSAPARAVPALRYLLTGGPPLHSKTEQALVSAVRGGVFKLRQALEALDRAFETGSHWDIQRCIRRCMQLCKRECPERLRDLQKQVHARCFLAEMSPRATQEAIGSPLDRDAAQCRLMAMAEELKHYFIDACASWHLFRMMAFEEGWFSEGSPEDAAVLERMIEVLHGTCQDDLEVARLEFLEFHEIVADEDEFATLPLHADPDNPNCYFMYEDQLYEKLITIRPDGELFQRWLSFRMNEKWQRRDEVAERWKKACPDDPRPLLCLMDSAEKRQAFKKALGYLELAEQIDELNPTVRRARFRLIVSTTLRHLKQQKAHLVAKDLEELERCPVAAEEDYPALLHALRWLCALLEQDGAAVSLHQAELEQALGPAGALVLIQNLARLSSFSSRAIQDLRLPKQDSLCESGVRALLLGDGLGLEFVVPKILENAAIKELKSKRCTLDEFHTHVLARAALYSPDPVRGGCPLALAATRYLATLPQFDSARFLMLRALSYPYRQVDRATECSLAALFLAQQRHQPELVSEVVDALHQLDRFSHYRDYMRELKDISPEEVSRILEAEIKGPARSGSFSSFFAPTPSRHPPPTQETSAHHAMFSFFEEEDDWDEEEDDWDEMGEMLGALGPIDEAIPFLSEMLFGEFGEIPPEVGNVMVEILLRTKGGAEPVDPALQQRFVEIAVRHGLDKKVIEEIRKNAEEKEAGHNNRRKRGTRPPKKRKR